jgi:hypothetical protein
MYLFYIHPLFSTPGQRPCEPLPSLGVRRPSVRPLHIILKEGHPKIIFSIFSMVAILFWSRDQRTQFWKRAIHISFYQSLVVTHFYKIRVFICWDRLGRYRKLQLFFNIKSGVTPEYVRHLVPPTIQSTTIYPLMDQSFLLQWQVCSILLL